MVVRVVAPPDDYGICHIFIEMDQAMLIALGAATVDIKWGLLSLSLAALLVLFLILERARVIPYVAFAQRYVHASIFLVHHAYRLSYTTSHATSRTTSHATSYTISHTTSPATSPATSPLGTCTESSLPCSSWRLYC